MNVDLLQRKLFENIGGRLLGNSKSTKKLKEMMAKVAETDNTSVLILGESGTGKELVAHGIHYLSKRNKNPFYSVNCSAIPESLFENLYHRLSIFVIEIPPLRDRREDIPVLMEYYMNQYAQKMQKGIQFIDEHVYDLIEKHPLPGNVRQLKNCIERAVILCEGDTILPDHFRLSEMHNSSISGINSGIENAEENFDLESNEKQLIIKALEKAEGNKSRAASILNITWQSLNRRMKKFGIE
ncbi:unnamed protein product [Cyprideis torosa]|uniref:Uncharacterized protein n=1 Tax=Cyprideis torosa TaxID=163714 RepID=A0A7R8WS52_9CRUS|nr:unnamed protein product [Cyprideis torosa]CAG0907940.1 unnamed protein product [Cyprideis torosa]